MPESRKKPNRKSGKMITIWGKEIPRRRFLASVFGAGAVLLAGGGALLLRNSGETSEEDYVIPIELNDGREIHVRGKNFSRDRLDINADTLAEVSSRAQDYMRAKVDPGYQIPGYYLDIYHAYESNITEKLSKGEPLEPGANGVANDEAGQFADTSTFTASIATFSLRVDGPNHLLIHRIDALNGTDNTAGDTYFQTMFAAMGITHEILTDYDAGTILNAFATAVIAEEIVEGASLQHDLASGRLPTDLASLERLSPQIDPAQDVFSLEFTREIFQSALNGEIAPMFNFPDGIIDTRTFQRLYNAPDWMMPTVEAENR